MSPNSSKSEQKTAKMIRLDDIHWQLVRGLIPFYGTSEPEVVRNIVVMWLHENISGKSIEKLEQLGATHLKEQTKSNGID
jgi:hypothetical protein